MTTKVRRDEPSPRLSGADAATRTDAEQEDDEDMEDDRVGGHDGDEDEDEVGDDSEEVNIQHSIPSYCANPSFQEYK